MEDQNGPATFKPNGDGGSSFLPCLLLRYLRIARIPVMTGPTKQHESSMVMFRHSMDRTNIHLDPPTPAPMPPGVKPTDDCNDPTTPPVMCPPSLRGQEDVEETETADDDENISPEFSGDEADTPVPDEPEDEVSNPDDDDSGQDDDSGESEEESP
jgi:hypothetical protein